MSESERMSAARAAGGGPPLPPRQVAALVQTAARAPSVHNTQPWRFRVDGNVLEVRADRARRLAAVDPRGREMLISCGAAVYGARLAARSLGYRPDLWLLPDPRQPDLVARVRLAARLPVTARERALLAAVPHRHTRRGGFTGDPLPPGLLAGLQHDAIAEGAVLMLVRDLVDYQRLADLVEAAGRWQRDDRLVRAELARWTRPPDSTARDGVPARAYPATAGPGHGGGRGAGPAGGPAVPRDFDLGRGRGLVPGGGPLPGTTAILLTAADTPADWLRAGQALYRLLLHAASRWVFASLHTEPLESPRLRELVRVRLGLQGAPQVVLAFGPASTALPTPRRRLAEVVSRTENLG